MYMFYLPIGDVFADGHGLFEKFLVQSNLPVEKVREAHYHIPEATGINIEGICNAYQEDTVEPETAEKLRGMGLLDVVDGDPLPVDDMAELWLASGRCDKIKSSAAILFCLKARALVWTKRKAGEDFS